MPYQVLFAPAAEREFRALPQAVQVRLASRINALAAEPRPTGSAKLAGPPDLYRIRIGDYRVIYAIDDGRLLVLVVRAAHRREVYRRLPPSLGQLSMAGVRPLPGGPIRCCDCGGRDVLDLPRL